MAHAIAECELGMPPEPSTRDLSNRLLIASVSITFSACATAQASAAAWITRLPRISRITPTACSSRYFLISARFPVFP